MKIKRKCTQLKDAGAASFILEVPALPIDIFERYCHLPSPCQRKRFLKSLRKRGSVLTTPMGPLVEIAGQGGYDREEPNLQTDRPCVRSLGRGAQPVAHGPQVAQDGYKCGPTQNHKFT